MGKPFGNEESGALEVRLHRSPGYDARDDAQSHAAVRPYLGGISSKYQGPVRRTRQHIDQAVEGPRNRPTEFYQRAPCLGVDNNALPGTARAFKDALVAPKRLGTLKYWWWKMASSYKDYTANKLLCLAV